MKATGGVQGFKMACGENPKSWGADDDNEGPTSRQRVVTYMRQQFLNARRYKRAVEHARAGTGAMPPRDLKPAAPAGILSGDIRVNVHCISRMEEPTSELTSLMHNSYVVVLSNKKNTDNKK